MYFLEVLTHKKNDLPFLKEEIITLLGKGKKRYINTIAQKKVKSQEAHPLAIGGQKIVATLYAF